MFAVSDESQIEIFKHNTTVVVPTEIKKIHKLLTVLIDLSSLHK